MMGEEGRGEEGGGALPIYIPVYATDLYYRVGQKSCHFAFVYIFANYWPIFKVFFTGTYCEQIAIKSLLNILPHFNSVATLPCETYIFKNHQNRYNT